MPFLYSRTIYFHDTDAAGVVYFANVLSICHEAYEASLIAVGINLQQFFGDCYRAIPIVHATVDFFQPMFCGETYMVSLEPQQLKPSEFSITYTLYPHAVEGVTGAERPKKGYASHFQITPASKAIAKAYTRHVCINLQQRTRLILDDVIVKWMTQTATVKHP